MLSEKGYYYYSYTDRGLRYYDFSTQKDIFLCNKPECLHDGNAFCVATNRKYGKIDYVLYGDRIYMSAFELDENERIQMKLLADGTYLYCFVTPKVMNKDRTEFQSIRRMRY